MSKRQRVLEAAAILSEERSLRFRTENALSMELSHGEYEGMKSSSTPG